MIILREYQEKAMGELSQKLAEFVRMGVSKKLVFKAPTGSGKTVIVAETLKKLISDKNLGSLSFIWAAPRSLHSQSKEKLECYYSENKALQCSYFEDLQNKAISQNEILFLNWESINKKDNIYIKENENDFNLSNILSNTKSLDNKIILIIDESHFAAETENSLGLIEMIQPLITLDISATPRFIGDEQVTIQREAVIRDEMIKRYIAINQGLKNDIIGRTSDTVKATTTLPESNNAFIIKEALNKRVQLATTLKQLGCKVNPLLMVQLPDRRAGLDDLQEEIFAILKANHGITRDNGRLAVYLAEDKHNLETISKNDDNAEVMIFKQAIALGWDCPRAYILLMLREMHSDVFTIQTIGRIMRMAELKYYPEDSLNIGYIYTNLTNYVIQGQDSFGYLVSQNSKIKPIYQPINLPSVHPKRFREETRLAPKYITHFLNAAQELKLKEKLDTSIAETYRSVITDGVIHDIDKTAEYNSGPGGKIDLKQNEEETQREFDLFIIDALKPLFPEPRSVSRVKTSIYMFFQNTFPDVYSYGGIQQQKITLAPQNAGYFRNVINRAKETYFIEVGKIKTQLVPDEDWNIPPVLNYDDGYIKTSAILCVVEPFYQRNNASEPERSFAAFLDSKKGEIEWWYKNGDSDGTNFAVPYNKNGETHAFYVDWIVKYKNGKIGLFDTKSGQTAETAKEKAEGLAAYINEQNENGKNLFGGIVVRDGTTWRYNDHVAYQFDPKDLSTWQYL